MGEHQYVFFFISSEGLKINAYRVADTNPAGIHFLNKMCYINTCRKNCIYFSHAEEMR